MDVFPDGRGITYSHDTNARPPSESSVIDSTSVGYICKHKFDILGDEPNLASSEMQERNLPPYWVWQIQGHLTVSMISSISEISISCACV